MKLHTAALLVVGPIAGTLAGWYMLLHCNVDIAGGNTCTVAQLGPQPVNNKLKPPHFQLAADDEASDGNTIHGPADLGLTPYKPIPADQQAELDNCTAITSASDFDADMMARLKRLHLDLVMYGPRLQNGNAVIMVEVVQKVTPELKAQFDRQMQGFGQGYPILLKHGERMHLLIGHTH